MASVPLASSVKCESCGGVEKTPADKFFPHCSNMTCSEYGRIILPPIEPGKKYVRIHCNSVKYLCVPAKTLEITCCGVIHAIDSIFVEVRNKQNVCGSIPDTDFIKRRRQELRAARELASKYKKLYLQKTEVLSTETSRKEELERQCTEKDTKLEQMKREIEQLKANIVCKEGLLKGERAISERKLMEQDREAAEKLKKQEEKAQAERQAMAHAVQEAREEMDQLMQLVKKAVQEKEQKQASAPVMTPPATPSSPVAKTLRVLTLKDLVTPPARKRRHIEQAEDSGEKKVQEEGQKRTSPEKTATLSGSVDEIVVLNPATPRPDKIVVDAAEREKTPEKKEEDQTGRRSTRVRKSVDYAEYITE